MGSSCCSKSLKEDVAFLSQSTQARVTLSPGYLAIPNRFSLPKSSSRAGLAGLVNLGNTCYINAALQCLSNCQPLTDYFLSSLWKVELGTHEQATFTELFARFVEVQWTHSYSTVGPRKLVDLIVDTAPQFEWGRQHDSQELLTFLLDRLHQELNRGGSDPLESSLLRLTGNELLAATAWMKHLSIESSVIVDLFQGQLQSSVVCQACGHCSLTYDPFMYLSVELPINQTCVDLEDCLAQFTKNEQLQDHWDCPKCKAPREALKKLSIWKVPSILIIYLKRFKFEDGAYTKLKPLVKYPVGYFDMNKFVSGPQKDPPLYDLFSFLCHVGDVDSGHYTAVAKNWQTKDWNLFDDTAVCPLESDSLVNESAYVLFYHKRGVEEFNRQTNSHPELWPHCRPAPASWFSQSFVELSAPKNEFNVSAFSSSMPKNR